MPLVARSPEELTAANVTSSTFDSVGLFAGPALGAFLIALSGYTAAFTVIAVTFAWSAFFVLRISTAAVARSAPAGEDGDHEGGGLRDCSTASGRSPTSRACGC